MKSTVKLFFIAVLFLTAISFTNSYSQDSQNYSIEGIWERASTDEALSGARVQVTKDGDVFTGKYTLVTQQMVQACYETGEVKWFNIIKGNKGLYNMSDLYKTADCSSKFTDKYIEFVDESKINITAMGIPSNTDENFQVWVRVVESSK